MALQRQQAQQQQQQQQHGDVPVRAYGPGEILDMRCRVSVTRACTIRACSVTVGRSSRHAFVPYARAWRSDDALACNPLPAPGAGHRPPPAGSARAFRLGLYGRPPHAMQVRSTPSIGGLEFACVAPRIGRCEAVVLALFETHVSASNSNSRSYHTPIRPIQRGSAAWRLPRPRRAEVAPAAPAHAAADRASCRGGHMTYQGF